MKFADISIQTLILALPFIAWPVNNVEILAEAFVIGIAQLTSCILTILNNAPFRRERLWHLRLSIAFFCIYFLFAKIGVFNDNETWHLVFPGMLCLYYYIITLVWAVQPGTE